MLARLCYSMFAHLEGALVWLSGWALLANWITICQDTTLHCVHGNFSLRTAFSKGPVLPTLQLGSLSLALACWGYFELLCCAHCFAVSQHRVMLPLSPLSLQKRSHQIPYDSCSSLYSGCASKIGIE